MAVFNLLSNSNNESGLLPAKQKNKLISRNSNTGTAEKHRTNVRSMVELFDEKKTIDKHALPVTRPKPTVKTGFQSEKQESILSSSVTTAGMSQKHAVNAGYPIRNSSPKPFSIERESHPPIPSGRERKAVSPRDEIAFRTIVDKSPVGVRKTSKNNSSDVGLNLKPSVPRKGGISSSLNYFELKIDNSKPATKGPLHSPGNTESGNSLSAPYNQPKLVKRSKNDANRASLNENILKRNNLVKPAVPIRPRVNTSCSSDLDKRQVPRSPKRSPALHQKVKNLEEELSKEIAENPRSFSPRSPIPSPKKGVALGPPRRPVNPVPKPQRTFTFKMKDHNSNVTSPPMKPPLPNIRKSSRNSSSEILKELPTPPTERNQSSYEEVVFFGTADGKYII